MKFKNTVTKTTFILGALTLSTPTYGMDSTELEQKHSSIRRVISNFLARTKAEFDAALSSEEKYEIISRPVNLEHLLSLKCIEDLNETALTQGVGSGPLSYMAADVERLNADKSTPLALAVSLGKPDFLSHFLSVVTNVNAPELITWGYRQPYFLSHLALDPSYPYAPASLEKRLAIIDALAQKGADFNANFQHGLIGVYNNPPLAAGWGRGHQLPDVPHLRARALAYGADPMQGGSSFDPISFQDDPKLLELAACHAREIRGESRPVAFLKELFERFTPACLHPIFTSPGIPTTLATAINGLLATAAPEQPISLQLEDNFSNASSSSLTSSNSWNLGPVTLLTAAGTTAFVGWKAWQCAKNWWNSQPSPIAAPVDSPSSDDEDEEQNHDGQSQFVKSKKKLAYIKSLEQKLNRVKSSDLRIRAAVRDYRQQIESLRGARIPTDEMNALRAEVNVFVAPYSKR